MEIKNIKIKTFGCRLNQADEALIFAKIANSEIPDAQKNNPSKIIIINTCTVTANAAKKGRQAARQMRKKFPDALIVVTGCDAETNTELWLNDNSADIVIPGSLKSQISQFIEKKTPEKKDNSSVFEENITPIFPFKTRPLIKIQEGCDCFCAFCIVPFARGKPRSRCKREILDDIRKMIDCGHKEITLTGVNICYYKDGSTDLTGLIREILQIKGNFRIRLSSIELDQKLYEIVKLIRDDQRLCRFLHIPLQHGSDRILEKMNRKQKTNDFANFAEFALNSIPGLHLGTDIICGLPGEDDNAFDDSFKFISSIPFANMHLFRYSPRPGTAAAKMTDLPLPKIVNQRMKILQSLKSQIQNSFISKQIGKNASFIGEKKSKDNYTIGWSDNYIKTAIRELETNQLVKITFSAVAANMQKNYQAIAVLS